MPDGPRRRNKPPAFQFYGKDWLSSSRVGLLSPAAEGLLIRLMAMEWDNEGLPADPEELKTLVLPKYHRDWEMLWKSVQKSFVKKGKRLVHPKLEMQRKELRARSKMAREKALRRWDSDATALPRHMLGHMPEPCSASASAVIKNWSREAGLDWAAAYGGTAPFGKIGAQLKEIVATLGWDVVRPAWKRYLAATESRFASAKRFSDTWDSWAERRGDQYLTPQDLAS